VLAIFHADIGDGAWTRRPAIAWMTFARQRRSM
jgi:hypothetical protein